MNKDSREIYRKFCQTEKKLPLFSQDWWLDAVTYANGGTWNAAIAYKGDEIIGVMAYILKNGKITHPPLTPRLGPYLIFPEGIKYQTKLHHEAQVLAELINQLPKFSYFAQSFFYNNLNWLPFYWDDYSATPRYSYIIKSGTNPDELIKESHQTLRKCINKADKIVIVKEIDDINPLHELSNSVFLRKKIKNPISLNFLKELDLECKKHSCRKILAAYDSDNNLHAVLYIVWDDYFAYSLYGGSDYNFRSSQAVSLLYKEAIYFALNSGRSFDFEGTMLKEVEPQFRQFGGTQTMYLQVNKDNRSLIKRGFDYIKRRIHE